MKGLITPWFDKLTTNGINKLTTNGINKLTTNVIDKLSTNGIDKVTTNGINNLPQAESSAYHERVQPWAVRPELVEGLTQRFLELPKEVEMSVQQRVGRISGASSAE